MGQDLDIRSIYQAHALTVSRRAHNLLGNLDDAHEIMQDVFVALLGAPERFAGRSSIETYLYRMTTNRCLNLLRNRRRRQRIMATKVEVSGECQPRVSSIVRDPEAYARLRSALVRMPEDVAAVAIYYYLDYMNQTEIARMLGYSRRRVARLLRQVLTTEEEFYHDRKLSPVSVEQ